MHRIFFSAGLFFFLLSAAGFVNAQNQDKKFEMTGSLITDNNVLLTETAPPVPVNLPVMPAGKKSVILTGLMSLVVPGAGEVYTGEYLKAGIFLALEAAVITTAVIYDKKGNDQTAVFQKYADANWSVKKYAEWTVANSQYVNPEVDVTKFNVFKQDGSVNWVELNRLESALGKGYSHNLPPYGEQQYYELIGKYPQFSSGWDDYDPAQTDFYHNVTPHFRYYSGERGKANDYYNVASKAVVGIYINHFLSMLDAAWSAINYNKNLSVSMRVENSYFAGKFEYVPTLNMTLNF